MSRNLQCPSTIDTVLTNYKVKRLFPKQQLILRKQTKNCSSITALIGSNSQKQQKPMMDYANFQECLLQQLEDGDSRWNPAARSGIPHTPHLWFHSKRNLNANWRNPSHFHHGHPSSALTTLTAAERSVSRLGCHLEPEVEKYAWPRNGRATWTICWSGTTAAGHQLPPCGSDTGEHAFDNVACDFDGILSSSEPRGQRPYPTTNKVPFGISAPVERECAKQI